MGMIISSVNHFTQTHGWRHHIDTWMDTPDTDTWIDTPETDICQDTPDTWMDTPETDTWMDTPDRHMDGYTRHRHMD